MYAVTSMPLVNFTRATLRSAEFGFFGVVVYTRVHTPRRCGLPLSAAVLVLATLSVRPLRTSCWIVGIDRLPMRGALLAVAGIVPREITARRPSAAWPSAWLTPPTGTRHCSTRVEHTRQTIPGQLTG